MKDFIKKYINEDMEFDKKTKIGIFALLIVITGIFGFVYEFIFYYFNSGMKEFYYRGGNFLPWINIYAIGALAIYFLAYKHRKKPIRVLLTGIISSGIIELIGGYMLYKLGNGFRCWDYNSEILNFGNIGGFVCLRSVLFFGVSGLLLIYGMIPLCFFIATKMNKKVFFIVTITLCSIFLLDEIYNLAIARALDLPRASDIYKDIGFKYMEF